VEVIDPSTHTMESLDEQMLPTVFVVGLRRSEARTCISLSSSGSEKANKKSACGCYMLVKSKRTTTGFISGDSPRDAKTLCSLVVESPSFR